MSNTQATRVKGTITEQHSDDIRKVFGDDVAKRVEQAKEGETFLSILFNVK